MTSDDIRDGENIDLVVLDSERGQVGVLLGYCDGTFEDPLMYPCDNYPNSVALAHFNDDDKVDATEGEGGDTGVSILF